MGYYKLKDGKGLENNPKLPDFPIPQQYENDYHNYLKDLVFKEAVKQYQIPLPDEVKERLNEELSDIREKGIEREFLITADLIQAVRNMKLLTDCVTNSLVHYLLIISNFNPLEYNLPYSSKEEVILKFSKEGREKAIEYLTQKYGADSIWFASSYLLKNEICPIINHVVITSQSFQSFVPMSSEKIKHLPVCLLDTEMLRKMKFFTIEINERFDLDRFSFVLDEIKHKQGIEINLKDIPLDDVKVFEQLGFNDYHEYHSVFNKEDFQNYIKKLQPTNIEQLAVLRRLFKNTHTFLSKKNETQKELDEYVELKNIKKHLIDFQVMNHFKFSIAECIKAYQNIWLKIYYSAEYRTGIKNYYKNKDL